MALVNNTALFADLDEFFDTHASSLKNSLTAAGFTTVWGSSSGTATSRGEAIPAVIIAPTASTASVRANLRFVRPGWKLEQLPGYSSRVLDVLIATTQVKVVTAVGMAAGAAELVPDWPIRFTFDLDSTNRIVHCRAFKTSGFLGQIGNLIGDTSIQLPPTDPFTAWLVGDGNGFALVAKHGVGDYRVAYFGVYAPTRDFLRSFRTVLGADEAAGQTVLSLAASEASSSGVQVGMTVYIANITTGVVEKHTVTAVSPGPNEITVSPALVVAMPSGSIISRDPFPYALSGSLAGPFGRAYTATAPDSQPLDPLVTVSLSPKTFTGLEGIRFASDAEGQVGAAALRYQRFGTSITEEAGVNPRIYELALADGVAPPANESTIAVGRESGIVFTDAATGRKVVVLTSTFSLLLADG